MMARLPKFETAMLEGLGIKVTHLVTDSRKVMPGDTFVAYPGGAADGRNFIPQALGRGANAVIWEADGFSWKREWATPNLAVRDLRHHAGEIADYIYGRPTEKLWMVGITGTNGKTSCSHWLAQALGTQGRKTALVGTLGNGFQGALKPTLNTTPDAIELHGLFAEYVRAGAQGVVMEVSSHALAQGRVNGVRYDVALLTNLSRDHLDYHGDMQSYGAAKRRLFDWENLRYAVLNLDDDFGFETAGQLLGRETEIVGYGLTKSALEFAEKNGIRMVYCGNPGVSQVGLDMALNTSWGSARLVSGLMGRFNASNMLGALAVLLVSGITLDAAVQALARVDAAPGRMQSIGGAGKPAVVVDYAHTPDALQKVLQSLREVAGSGKLVCVFGCGGDRDRGKRPMMGQVAANLADVCIVTSDNPRSEEPDAIINEIIGGMAGKEYIVVTDRLEAIRRAIMSASAEDTVLLAGKGHEPYQEIKGVRHPFSDLEQANQALASWGMQA